MATGEPVLIGIDLNDRYAMVSYYKVNMDEPETVSMIAGSQSYAIPVILAKRKNLGMWYYGDEALRIAKSSDLICIDSLLKRALLKEQILIDDEKYEAEELLALYIRKIIQMAGKLGNISDFDKLVISVDRLNKENMELLWRVASRLALSKDQFMVIDYRESFYYYVMHQDERLWYHDVYLFRYERDNVSYYVLNRDINTKPQMISIVESQKIPVMGDKDLAFLQILTDAFSNKIASSSYLVGEGFEGDWMQQSLNYLCRGRRAFMGNNLFSKGACYAAIASLQEEWPYVYMGENEMKFNVSLKLRNKGKLEFYTLITAGKNWYELENECEVILTDTPEIHFWKQLPKSREAIVETVQIDDLPSRPDKTTRLRIKAKPVAVDKVEIEIKDLGFGEIYRSTDKSWKYIMTM